MVRDGFAVRADFAAAVAAAALDERFDVTAACRSLGVGRTTFYKYKRRFLQEGVEGFFPRSRAPGSHPNEVAGGWEEAVVRARKELAEEGLDAGAISIGWRLEDTHQGQVVPSRATIHRLLVRRGMVVPAPRKRPRRSRRRFEAAAANAMWQMDGFEFKLAGGSKVVVIQVLDDHTRLDLALHAGPSENTLDVWAAFTTAAARYGLPARILTDNGTAFSGQRRGWASSLETGLRTLGVQPIAASVGHPQTCGKNERAHSTVRRWLAARPRPATLTELQELLDAYRQVYNNQRRHQSLNGLTPAGRWAIAPRSGPASAPMAEGTYVLTTQVSPAGCIAVDSTEIGLGRRYARAQATTFRTGDDVTVFINGTVVRELTLDRTRRYQPNTT